MSHIDAERELHERKVDVMKSEVPLCTLYATVSLLPFSLSEAGLAYFYDIALKGNGLFPQHLMARLMETGIITCNAYQQPRSRIYEALQWMKERAELGVVLVEKQRAGLHTYSLEFQANDTARVYDLQQRPPEVQGLDRIAQRIAKRGGPPHELFILGKGPRSNSRGK